MASEIVSFSFPDWLPRALKKYLEEKNKEREIKGVGELTASEAIVEIVGPVLRPYKDELIEDKKEEKEDGRSS